nr:MAG TPA: hypothetical protein [Caudoviricetes sp.]
MTICRAGDRLKTVPRSADTTWILIFCPVRMDHGVPKCPVFVPKSGPEVGLITH